ncbi:MAG: acyl-CoA dehydrogenase family protein, partial [Desulfobacterales bacterium]
MEYTISAKHLNVIETVKTFVKEKLEPISLQVEKEGEIPEAIVDEMRRLGLFGLSIPEKYGGLGLSTLGEVLVYEEMTRTNACFRSRIGTNNGIGSMGILFDGTEEQKKNYLPRIASGRLTAAFALTEPNAGSDAAQINTSAVLDGDVWIINGSKLFITNGGWADCFTTIVVTDENKRTRGGFTAFVIEKGMPGFTIGNPDRKMGMRGSLTNELIFRNCRVPRENVIGGMRMVGQGFKTAMRVLDKGRLTIGAAALGAAQKLLELCIQRVKRKVKNGDSPDPIQSNRFMLADMATGVYAARQMLYHSAWLRDQGNNVAHEASMVKLFCTETASNIADKAMEIFEDE